jgi:hypothetical protein
MIMSWNDVVLNFTQLFLIAIYLMHVDVDDLFSELMVLQFVLSTETMSAIDIWNLSNLLTVIRMYQLFIEFYS